LSSHQVLVNYMTPLGLHHIMGYGHHYGPAPWFNKASREDWNCTYFHRADSIGIGFDRTAKGSNALLQYALPIQQQWGNIKTTGDQWLTWFHHVPWNYTMNNGQSFWYNLAIDYQKGVDGVRLMQKQWQSVKGTIDEQRFEQVNKLLIQVGMPNARIKIAITPASLNEYGKDNIEFLFDANKSNRFEPLRKVASGGELSRLMLCIKSLVAESIDLPTLIFDEIDTGISGEAAKQVGNIMKKLAASRQVICITHQPQIAGKADAHFFVYKEIKNDAVKASIRLLTTDERITTIAQMLSGEKPTAAALQNAREMVMN